MVPLRRQVQTWTRDETPPRSREDILTRYRCLRAINKRHHHEAFEFVSRSALLGQARRLGMAEGKTLVAENEDELTLVFDLSVYTAAPERSRAIDRYARSARVAPGSDEDCVLRAMREARFSIFEIEGAHETAGLWVQDLMREEEVWLVDENMQCSAPVGMIFAGRLCAPDAFAMTCGVFVPVDDVIVDAALDKVLGCVAGELDAIADDRRFATAIYQLAVMFGAMDRVRFVDPC